MKARTCRPCKQRTDSHPVCLVPIQLRPETNHATRRQNDLDCDQIDNARTAPLGWYTGPGASQLVAHSSKASVKDVCKLADTLCNPVQP